MAEPTTPTPGEITILVSGAVGLIFSFFHFYTSPSIVIAGHSVGGGGVSAWSSGLFPVATIIPISLAVMAVVVALTRFADVSMPPRVAGFTWTQIHLALGFFAALYALAWLVKDKGGADFGIGFWFILLASIGAFISAILLVREQQTSAGRAGPNA